MKILVDARWPKGTGIRRMADLYSAYAPNDVNITDLKCKTRIGNPASPLAISDAIYKQRNKSTDEVFWNPGFIPPLPKLIKSVVTVHDLTHLHFYTKSHRLYYNSILRPLYRRCDQILCVSEYTRNEFLNWSGMSEEQVAVIPNAIHPNFANFSESLKGVKPFIFYAGNRRAYKNIYQLIYAYAASGLWREGIELVLTGEFDRQLKKCAYEAGVGDLLRFTGYLDDSALVAHYKAALCFAFLSKYEGFGLPVLEAMACDTPLLLANSSSLPEVAENAAYYVNANNIEEIASGLKSLCMNEDVRKNLIENGRIRRNYFRADISAAKLWGAIKYVSLR